MSNLSGWGLTGRLIAKHFGGLGDKVAEMIANFDPETATQADRDRLAESLRSTAQKLAVARSSFNKEHDDVVKLRALVATDEAAAVTLATRLADGTITEATITLFCDELEANKARLPNEMQEESDAKEYMDELQLILDALSKQLTEFDAVAKKALQQLATAHAQKDLQASRAARQEEISGLKATGGHSTALSALTRRAQAVSNEAAGMKIVADINQKPLDQAAELDAIRKSVSASAIAETPLERIKRLTAKPAAEEAVAG